MLLFFHVSSFSVTSKGLVSFLYQPPANMGGSNLIQKCVLRCSLSSLRNEIIYENCSLAYSVNFLARINQEHLYMYVDIYISAHGNVLT